MATVRYPESGGAYRNARAKARANGDRISQERLAYAVGVTKRTIVRYENGETRPSPAVRDSIAEFLHVDPCKLPSAGDHPFAADRNGSKVIRSTPGSPRKSVASWIKKWRTR